MVELDVDLWLRGEDVAPEKELIFTDSGERGEIPKEGEKENVETFEIGVELPDKTRK